MFFRNMFGPQAERALSVFVTLSALGNVLSDRVNQELDREGVLPFSKFFAGSRPFNAPTAGLALHWLITVITILVPPPGDAFNLILNLISYPFAVINMLISGGLLYLRFSPGSSWQPVFAAWPPVTAFFFLSNIFLVVVPFIPSQGASGYQHLPYYLHAVGGPWHSCSGCDLLGGMGASAAKDRTLRLDTRKWGDWGRPDES